jgi:hypothetical protein
MKLGELEKTMAALARERPVFHSEADFQHAFAWQLRDAYPGAHLRLETRPRAGVRLDVLALIAGVRVAFELKYLLRKLSAEVKDEVFDLPYQGAQDTRRYDFVKDVGRLEILRHDGLADSGFALALTNDPSYWQSTGREDVADAAFRLGEGRTLRDLMAWAAHTGAGTMRGREAPLSLVGSYELQWRNYSRFPDARYGEFRYLVVQVDGVAMAGGELP